MDLDSGEASALALSLDISDSIIIIDDLKGRKIADKLDLRYSGTLGLILKAKQEGVIESIKPIIAKIKHTNFRFSEELIEFLFESGRRIADNFGYRMYWLKRCKLWEMGKNNP